MRCNTCYTELHGARAAGPWAERPIALRAVCGYDVVVLHQISTIDSAGGTRRGGFTSNERPARSAELKRILVIDDDARLRQQCAELLRSEGYEVFEARNGREGIDRARRELPDLVLCDITMPEMNGHRVLETLRAEPRTAHLPFVFLTGWDEQEDVRTGMNLGADDYLTKPVAPDELTTAVRARLRRAEAARPGRSGPAREPTPSDLETLGLTPREAEVLFWLARGKTNDEIATVLGIGLTTVKKHLESTYAKLGVENRTAAAAMALERMSGVS